jgi:hypothetical protein
MTAPASLRGGGGGVFRKPDSKSGNRPGSTDSGVFSHRRHQSDPFLRNQEHPLTGDLTLT